MSPRDARKLCKACDQEKPTSAFYAYADGRRQSRCKVCSNKARCEQARSAALRKDHDEGPPTARELYEREPLEKGVTIAEWEAALGLPLFTVWPEAEAARGPNDPGWFLYCCAADPLEKQQAEGES